MMNQMIVPPLEPKGSESIHSPIVYVKEPLKWEYKQVIRDVEKEGPFNEVDLNTLGEQGWELAGILAVHSSAYYYFKRISE